MQRCAAVKKKGSMDPCPAKAVRAHTLCGRHARMRSPQLWTDAHRERGKGLLRVQAVVRGWIVRKRMKLAGPGVLCRKNLVNDEELVTCIEKERQDPMDYFAFEEGGKVWWFSFASIWKWTCQSFASTNPYTKEPLTIETRKRLRELWAYKHRHREQQPEESTEYAERLRTRLNTICQTFHDNGFIDIQPSAFQRLDRSDYASLFVLLGRDIETVFPVHDPFREKALRFCRRTQETIHTLPHNIYILHCVYTLKVLLSLHREPYAMVFSVLSALYRC
jgi:hypothetical protein